MVSQTALPLSPGRQLLAGTGKITVNRGPLLVLIGVVLQASGSELTLAEVAEMLLDDELGEEGHAGGQMLLDDELEEEGHAGGEVPARAEHRD